METELIRLELLKIAGAQHKDAKQVLEACSLYEQYVTKQQALKKKSDKQNA